MKTYERPVVLVNSNVAEGVFLASGQSQAPTVVKTDVQEWGSNGQATFKISVEEASNFIVNVEYNQEIDGSWSNDNIESTVSGSSATYKSWTAGPRTITVVVSGKNIGPLEVKSASVSTF